MTEHLNGKEIVSVCSWCEKDGVQTYLKDGQRITDELDLWDIEDKIEKDIAGLSHGFCENCLEIINIELEEFNI